MVLLGFVEPSSSGGAYDGIAAFYGVLKDCASTVVFICCIIAAVRRLVFKPARYAVPPRYGKSHTSEAILVLGLIALLMLSESLFESSGNAALLQSGTGTSPIVPLSLAWIFLHLCSGASLDTLQALHLAAYTIHDLVFFLFLCFLPMGKHFHVITSLFNVFFMRLDKGTVKPVRYGIDDTQLDELPHFGVKRLEDFTWKHLLDFYTCADCGRCSDRCPANRTGRPLSPRFISIKGREHLFSRYPLHGAGSESVPLIGPIYQENEIWSCTTCGACEEECPLGIEYINKIVDLRRAMVDDGMVPQTLQKPLGALDKRGNPWGKMERKRSEWTKGLPEGMTVKLAASSAPFETLYFVDSISSYDDRMQSIARATAKILRAAGIDFGILGKDEKDSGNEVRRCGEEMLFQSLKEQNTEAILASGAKRIVTADPHALNTLNNDYSGLPEVLHISEIVLDALEDGKIKFNSVEDDSRTYVFHDPCYLGRHNGLYDPPRQIIRDIPGIRLVEMEGDCRDRSFCCGGGGLLMFYEPEEEQRMGVLRVQMARKAGADVIITACPFCLANIEDAIKVAGLEGKLEAIDLCELIDRHIQLPGNGDKA